MVSKGKVLQTLVAVPKQKKRQQQKTLNWVIGWSLLGSLKQEF